MKLDQFYKKLNWLIFYGLIIVYKLWMNFFLYTNRYLKIVMIPIVYW